MPNKDELHIQVEIIFIIIKINVLQDYSMGYSIRSVTSHADTYPMLFGGSNWAMLLFCVVDNSGHTNINFHFSLLSVGCSFEGDLCHRETR